MSRLFAETIPTDAISALLQIIDRYGLPLFTLVILALLVWRGILRFGPDVDRVINGLQAQVDYIEARRVEERTGREEAEERLASNNDSLRDATQGFKEANAIMKALMEAQRG